MKRTLVVAIRYFALTTFVIAFLSAVPAYAVPVTYTFFGSSDWPEASFSASFSFAYTAPDFITSLTILEAVQLDWWSISGSDYLSQVHFTPNDTNSWDSVGVNVPGVMSYFFFGEDSFSTLGLYSSIGANPGTLMVSSPVPEPATMLLLVSGLAGLAKFRRRFRRN